MVIKRKENDTIYIFPPQELSCLASDVTWDKPPTIPPNSSPTEVCRIVGDWYAACTEDKRREQAGQFLTPPIVARYMANLAGALHNDVRILDAGAGIGILACALCESALAQKVPRLSITAYESDPAVSVLCTYTFTYAQEYLRKHDLHLTFEVHQQDFIEAMAEQATHSSLWTTGLQPAEPFDIAILNPPYFKVNQKDRRAQLVKDMVQGRTNMYTMFMSLAASSLRAGGRFISITPRSFCSGAYFKHFRRQFFDTISPDLIHIFDSRRSAFEDAEVLQENIILSGERKSIVPVQSSYVSISRSQGIHDLAHPLIQQVERNIILDEKLPDPILHLPTSDIDQHLLAAFRRWRSTLATSGLEISTGPVVPFRCDDLLTSADDVEQGKAIPLLWLHHVHRMNIQWPIERFDKPQGLAQQAGNKLLVKNRTLVILRRFSAKEEPRRITAAVLPGDMFDMPYIGLENHLNYIYRLQGDLSLAEATGLAAFLNSSLVDRYFRITNGNTQVNATELRKLPLPSWEKIAHLGNIVVQQHIQNDFEATEQLLMKELREDLLVGNEEDDLQLPILHDSRIMMGKIQEAQRILQELGLPPAQQNEISALTLLALCNLREEISWSDISRDPGTIHTMMGFMKQYYGRIYAENTREVVRRQVIHQFEQARLIDCNPDDPSRSTNSPNTCYALTEDAFNTLVYFDTAQWGNAAAHFLEQHGALWEQYQQSRKAMYLPLKLADGKQLYLTPGKHNALQIAVIEKFGPRYAPGATVLYLGDAAHKFVIFEREKLETLGVPMTKHDKLPDIVLYDEAKNWLFLIEAVTSHGPVSHKRKREIEKAFSDSSVKRIYVTAFPDFAEFRRHERDIAWETHVWLADIPEHMIHYNGKRLLEPYE